MLQTRKTSSRVASRPKMAKRLRPHTSAIQETGSGLSTPKKLGLERRNILALFAGAIFVFVLLSFLTYILLPVNSNHGMDPAVVDNIADVIGGNSKEIISDNDVHVLVDNGESDDSEDSGEQIKEEKKVFENHNGVFGNSVNYDNYDINHWIQLNLQQNEFDESPEIFEKRMKIRDSFIKAWNDYDSKCHGQDELRPVGGNCNNWVGMGLTLIDALDTMYIMGLTQQFESAKSWVQSSLNVRPNKHVSFFETTIRCLGGLMSAFDLTSEESFLTHAVELAKGLGAAFGTASGLPLSEVNLKSGSRHAAGWTGGKVLLAEVGTIQLEFKSAADRSGGEQGPVGELGKKAAEIFAKLDPARNADIRLPLRGQFPIYLNAANGRPQGGQVTWGAMGDSFYEYLLKYYLYEGKSDEALRKMYVESSEGMLENLYGRCDECGPLYYIKEFNGGRKDAKMDELACFSGGMLALGVIHDVLDSEEMKARHTEAAENLGETCYQMYARQKSKLSPEYVRFGRNGMTVGGGGTDFYILRPETVETMFYLWRLTGDSKWREKAWNIYEAIEKQCRAAHGYSPILHVNGNPVHDPRGVMHSFFLAETLKYLYLLFSTPHLVPLDVYVFNTEAHPIRIPSTLPSANA